MPPTPTRFSPPPPRPVNILRHDRHVIALVKVVVDGQRGLCEDEEQVPARDRRVNMAVGSVQRRLHTLVLHDRPEFVLVKF